MRVTVLIALYNKAKYVEEALNSVLDQSFADFELLIIDDASTDGGLEKVKRYADPRIRIIENLTNTGAAAAHNLGHRLSRGEYIAIMGADDIIHPDRILKQVRFMDENPMVGMVGSWIQCFGARTDLIRYPQDDEAIRAALLFSAQLSQGACMIRRSMLIESGVQCPENWKLPGMDYFFLADFAKNVRVANLQEVLTYYRTGGTNMRHGRNEFEDRVARTDGALSLFNLPSGRENSILMLMLDGMFIKAPRASNIYSLRRLLASIVKINCERAMFPRKNFEAHLSRQWDLLFHHLPSRSPASALAYLIISPRNANWYRFNVTIRCIAKRLLHTVGLRASPL